MLRGGGEEVGGGRGEVGGDGEDVGGGGEEVGPLDRSSELTNHAPTRDQFWSTVDD